MLMIPSIAPEAINFPSGLLIEKKIHMNKDKINYMYWVNLADSLKEGEKNSNIIFISSPIHVMKQF